MLQNAYLLVLVAGHVKVSNKLQLLDTAADSQFTEVFQLQMLPADKLVIRLQMFRLH